MTSSPSLWGDCGGRAAGVGGAGVLPDATRRIRTLGATGGRPASSVLTAAMGRSGDAAGAGDGDAADGGWESGASLTTSCDRTRVAMRGAPRQRRSASPPFRLLHVAALGDAPWAAAPPPWARAQATPAPTASTLGRRPCRAWPSWPWCRCPAVRLAANRRRQTAALPAGWRPPSARRRGRPCAAGAAAPRACHAQSAGAAVPTTVGVSRRSEPRETFFGDQTYCRAGMVRFCRCARYAAMTRSSVTVSCRTTLRPLGSVTCARANPAGMNTAELREPLL